MPSAHNSAYHSRKLNAELLEESFDKIKPYASEFSIKFYENLFADYPAAEPLFANTSIEKQGSKLIQSLILVISNIKYPVSLATELQGLGARHVEYGALPEHYPLVGQTLLKTLGQFLKEDWTEELQVAWTDAYAVISEMMLDGADYDPQDIQLNPASLPDTEESGVVSIDTPTNTDQPAHTGLKPWTILIGFLVGIGAIALVINFVQGNSPDAGIEIQRNNEAR